MKARLLFGAILLIALSGCQAEVLPTPAPTDEAPPLLEETPADEAPFTEVAQEVPAPAREMALYVHPSGVFYLNVPAGWEIFDDSGPLQITLRFIPPPGYGSRMGLTVTNEGPLTPDGQRALADQRIAEAYGADSRYSKISQSDDGVGRFIVSADYDDGAGGRGEEVMVLQQAGPFFAVQRVFIAAPDEAILGESLRQSADSLHLDSLAIWGSQTAGINPAELIVTNTRVWTSGKKTIYAGDVFNGSAHPVQEIQVRAAFCSTAGAIRKEVIEPALVPEAGPGERAPFYIAIEDLPRNTTVCLSQATAKPVVADPLAAHSLGVELVLSRDNRGDTIATGRISNAELLPVTAVEITIVLSDSEGRIVGMGLVALEPADLLMPGAGRDFTLTFDDLGGDPAGYAVYTSARRFDLSDPSLRP